MAALGSQSIASSYEQLLQVDRDGGGNGTTHVNVKDGDNGTTFGFTIASDALMMSSTNRLEFGDDGTYIHQSADGVLDLVSDTEIEINATTIDMNGAVDISSTLAVGDTLTVAKDTGGGVTSAIINNSSAAGSSDEDAALIFQHAGFDGGKIVSDRSGNYDTTGQKQSHLKFYTSNNADDQLVMFLSKQKQVLINDDANASSTEGLTINQGASDDEIISLKSSDVAHGITAVTETDTYMRFLKSGPNDGGGRVDGLADAGGVGLEINGYYPTDGATRSTSANAPITMSAIRKDSSTGNPADPAGDKNILALRARNTCRFIWDSDGDFHADSSSTTFDHYNDAHLVRAYDLSHGKGVIKSKFDEFVDYQHENLAELGLVGREKDGTPNHFINVTGMQRLHNGAIWQQYTEMQKMKELMYDTMVEMLGKEKADAKLKNHDVKLLENKNLLN